ncbi:MAG: hypothetical protein NBV67_00390 [Tagaea sp.]|nr:hypothetical protein [Tagaea sp.]
MGAAAVALKVRPFDSVFREQAEWAGRLAVSEAERVFAENLEAGDGLNRAERMGIYFAAYVAQCGRSAIVEWDLVDATGAPVPCDPATIETVFRLNPDFALAFDKAYSGGEAAKGETEGNGSAPAPNGISAAGSTTAKAAAAKPIAGDVPI